MNTQASIVIHNIIPIMDYQSDVLKIYLVVQIKMPATTMNLLLMPIFVSILNNFIIVQMNVYQIPMKMEFVKKI